MTARKPPTLYASFLENPFAWPAGAHVWDTQKAEHHADQLAMSNSVDVVVYVMTPVARLVREARVERFDELPTAATKRMKRALLLPAPGKRPDWPLMPSPGKTLTNVLWSDKLPAVKKVVPKAKKVSKKRRSK